MPRVFVVVIASLALAGCDYGVTRTVPPDGRLRGPSGADGTYNCSDFDTQGQAQGWFEQQTGNPDGLDHDGDGIACESLP